MVSATQALELFNTRQSVRNYTSQQIDEEIIDRCIEAARLAPSACNSQPWKFIVVTDPEIKQQLAPMLVTPPLGMNKFATDAPVLVIVVRERPNLTSKIGELLRDKTYTLMDIGMATLQFCLQATAEGLGTCIMGWFNEKQVKKLLNIPSSKRAELIISMGYPQTEEIRPKQRKAKNSIYSKNSY